MHRVNYLIHEHKDGVIERYQEIGGIGNLKTTEDGTNKMRAMSKSPN